MNADDRAFMWFVLLLAPTGIVLGTLIGLTVRWLVS
jgi:hypothetical protein